MIVTITRCENGATRDALGAGSVLRPGHTATFTLAVSVPGFATRICAVGAVAVVTLGNHASLRRRSSTPCVEGERAVGVLLADDRERAADHLDRARRRWSCSPPAARGRPRLWVWAGTEIPWKDSGARSLSASRSRIGTAAVAVGL